MKTVPPRNRDLARIHAAAKTLGMDDPTYRSLLHRVAGVSSARDLDDAGRRAVIAEMARLGFKGKARAGAYAGRPAGELSPMLRKIEAILADGRLPWAYAHAISKRMFQVQRLEWLRDEQLHKLVDALSIASRRRPRTNAPESA